MLDPLKTSSYNFHLPDELIATHPVEPRDSAKLLVYDSKTDTITHTIFSALEDFLPPCSILFNDTKVIKARLFGFKLSGGKSELLINQPQGQNRVNCFIKGRVKKDTEIFFDDGVVAKVIALNDDGTRTVEFYKDSSLLEYSQLLEIIENIGHIPLPHYMHRDDEKGDEEDYQSVFATNKGAVAAPTASLHFTATQHQRICKKFKHAFVTLHVGSGTFRPVEAETITDHPMHSEYFNIPKDAQAILDSDEPLLCVGTTSTRTAEYYTQTKETSGEANLFLHPNNRPKRVNYLLTNFHLPQSTLLMLVASFIGLEQTLKLYDEAIKHRYRFYSYGDAMLII